MLSPESRLPKWFASAGIARASSELTMDYYVSLTGPPAATFTLRDFKGRHIASVIGQPRANEPETLEPHGTTGPIPYPMYEVITADGITEVIEHRRHRPFFYITDDPEVRRKLGVSTL